MSWNDAVAFCEWLGKHERQIYRLPTEAEWEYACRAGQATRYSSGDDPELLATVGNAVDGTLREKYPGRTYAIKAKDGYAFTAPVGRFRPNAFGLYDMHGNVGEWCADWIAIDYYSKSPTSDPLNSSGAFWSSGPLHARSTSRAGGTLGHQGNSNLGFRVARTM